MNEEDPGFSEYIAALAAKATRNAAAEALNNGRCIVIMEGTEIVKVYPNGHKEVIKTIGDAYVKET